MKWALILLFWTMPILAQTQASKLSWSQSLQLLKENNPEYRAALWTYRSTQDLELGAESGFYPSLSGSLNYSQSRSYLNANSDLNIGTGTGHSYSASLNLSQNLFSGLKDTYKSKQAQANTRVAQAVFQTAKAKISFQFITAYQSLLTAFENLKLSENIESRRKEDLRMVQLRYESGRENKGSVLLSQAYLEQAKYESLQAQHAIELAQTSLASFLGRDLAENLIVSDPVPIAASIEKPDFVRLANETPEHQQILANMDANLAAVGVARSGFFPVLSLTGSVGQIGPDFFPDETNRWTVGASLTIPLFDGGRDISTLRSSQSNLRSTESHRLTVDQDAVTNLQQAYQKYLESIQKLKVDESFQKAALVRAEVARSQYNNGLITFTDWDQIENDLITRQRTYLQSKRDRVLNEAAWNQTQGQGVLP